MKWIEICREHIKDQIEALQNDRFDLSVPFSPDNIQYTSDMHYHTVPEMASLISGKCIINYSNEKVQVESGCINVIPALLPHFGATVLSKQALSMVIAFEHVELSFIKGEGTYGDKLHASEVLTIKTEKKRNIKNYMNHICDIYKVKNKTSRSALQGLLLACFSELMIILDEDPITEDHNPHPKIYKVKQLITDNLSDVRLNVDFLSELIPCSPTYLSQLFHRKTGVRLSTYINEKRLSNSKQLIKNTNMNISEIAFLCGYSDPGYFARVFKKQTGITPFEYKKH